MPYLSKETLNTIRQELKAKYPDFKFGIKNVHNSTAHITIKKGTVDLQPGSINHFHPDLSVSESALPVIKGIIGVAMRHERIVSEDADYGSIPNYYVNLCVAYDYQKV